MILQVVAQLAVADLACQSLQGRGDKAKIGGCGGSMAQEQEHSLQGEHTHSRRRWSEGSKGRGDKANFRGRGGGMAQQQKNSLQGEHTAEGRGL